MGILSIFTTSAPKVGGFQIDAVLESFTGKSITLTEFPVEFGANVNDHRIVNPERYFMTGAISNTPLGFGLNDIGMIGVGAIASAVGGVAGGIISSAASYINEGVSAALLAGNEQTISEAAWENLSNLLYSGEPFDIVTGNETLTSMVLVSLDTHKEPENEDGIIFRAEMRKLNVVYTKLLKVGVKSKNQLSAQDSSGNQAAPSVQRGSVQPQEIKQ